MSDKKSPSKDTTQNDTELALVAQEDINPSLWLQLQSYINNFESNHPTAYQAIAISMTMLMITAIVALAIIGVGFIPGRNLAETTPETGPLAEPAPSLPPMLNPAVPAQPDLFISSAPSLTSDLSEATPSIDLATSRESSTQIDPWRESLAEQAKKRKQKHVDATTTSVSRASETTEHALQSRDTPPPPPQAFIDALNNRDGSPCLIDSIPESWPQPTTVKLAFPLYSLNCYFNNSEADGMVMPNWSWGNAANYDSLACYNCQFDYGDLSNFQTKNSYFPGFDDGFVAMDYAKISHTFMPGSSIIPHNSIPVGPERPMNYGNYPRGSTVELSITDSDVSGSRIRGYFISPTFRYVNFSDTVMSIFASSTFLSPYMTDVDFTNADCTGVTVDQFCYYDDDDEGNKDLECDSGVFFADSNQGSTWYGTVISNTNVLLDLSGATLQDSPNSGQTANAPTLVLDNCAPATITLHGVNASNMQISNSDITLDASNATLTGSTITQNSFYNTNFQDSVMRRGTQVSGNQFYNPTVGNTDWRGANVTDNTFHGLTCSTSSDNRTMSLTQASEKTIGAPCTKIPPSCISASSSFFTSNQIHPKACPGKNHEGIAFDATLIAEVTGISLAAAVAVLLGVCYGTKKCRESSVISSSQPGLFGTGSGDIQEAEGTNLLTTKPQLYDQFAL